MILGCLSFFMSTLEGRGLQLFWHLSGRGKTRLFASPLGEGPWGTVTNKPLGMSIAIGVYHCLPHSKPILAANTSHIDEADAARMIWELVEESCPAARNLKAAKAFEKVTTDHFGTFVKMGQHMEIQNQHESTMEPMISTDNPRSQRSKAGPCGTTPRCQEGSDDAATVPVDLLSLSSLLSQANWELHVSSHVFPCRIVHGYDITSHHILQYNQH